MEMVTVIIPPLSLICWLYDLVTWSVPLGTNFMIKSISMLDLFHIKVAQNVPNSTNSKNSFQIHSLHAQYIQYTQIFELKLLQCFLRVKVRWKNKKKIRGQICLNSENHGKNHLEATADKKQVFSSLLLVEVVLCHFLISQAGCGR